MLGTDIATCQGQPGLLDHALHYARRGWAVIPTCAKLPACAWKSYQQERPSPATLRRLFCRPDITGLAVILGSVSGGLACFDFDVQVAYDQWAATHSDLARRLPTVATARGRHVYFRGPAGFTKFADGEYRGTSRQYTVLPPSRHPAGTSYRWLVPLPDGELSSVDPFDAGLSNRADRADTAPPPPLFVSAAPTLFSAPALLQAIENAIVATLPTSQGQRNRCVFRLARHLKSIQAINSSDAGTIRPIVAEWHQRALPVIGTKAFLETWADFLQAWKKAQVPAGEGPIEAAFERAVASVPPPAATKPYGEGPIVLLAALCRELQRIVGDREFFLDCRTAGSLIGVEHTTAWRYLDALCADGILVPGTKGSKATRKASRFRFIERDSGGTDQ